MDISGLTLKVRPWLVWRTRPRRDEAGNATCVFDEAARDGQFEASIATLAVFGYGEGAEWRQRVEALAHEGEGGGGAACEGDGEPRAGGRRWRWHHRAVVVCGGSDVFLFHRRESGGVLDRI